jgi:hypothetical protein
MYGELVTNGITLDETLKYKNQLKYPKNKI